MVPAPLKQSAYKVILADPPWQFQTYSQRGQGKSASQHYGCMSLDDIAALPVHELADPGGCLLVMWCTWSQAAIGSHLKVIEGWGFKPCSGGAWAKVTAGGLPAFGTGYVLRDSCEPFFTATRGRVPAGLKRAERNIILAERRAHSEKPVQMHQMLERLVPDAPRAELFARQRREGWDCHGNEIDGCASWRAQEVA